MRECDATLWRRWTHTCAHAHTPHPPFLWADGDTALNTSRLIVCREKYEAAEEKRMIVEVDTRSQLGLNELIFTAPNVTEGTLSDLISHFLSRQRRRNWTVSGREHTVEWSFCTAAAEERFCSHGITEPAVTCDVNLVQRTVSRRDHNTELNRAVRPRWAGSVPDFRMIDELQTSSLQTSRKWAWITLEILNLVEIR